MGESLMEQRRVGDDGLRVVKPCLARIRLQGEQSCSLTVSQEEDTANSVPAAAVIQRCRALSGITGRKGCVGGRVSRM
jgi:hypothetical protein